MNQGVGSAQAAPAPATTDPVTYLVSLPNGWHSRKGGTCNLWP